MTVIVQQPTDSNGNPQPMVYDSDTGKIIVDSNGYVINGGKRLVNVPTISEYVSTPKTKTAGIQEAINYKFAEGGGDIQLTSGIFQLDTEYVSQQSAIANGKIIYVPANSLSNPIITIRIKGVIGSMDDYQISYNSSPAITPTNMKQASIIYFDNVLTENPASGSSIFSSALTPNGAYNNNVNIFLEDIIFTNLQPSETQYTITPIQLDQFAGFSLKNVVVNVNTPTGAMINPANTGAIGISINPAGYGNGLAIIDNVYVVNYEYGLFTGAASGIQHLTIKSIFIQFCTYGIQINNAGNYPPKIGIADIEQCTYPIVFANSTPIYFIDANFTFQSQGSYSTTDWSNPIYYFHSIGSANIYGNIKVYITGGSISDNPLTDGSTYLSTLNVTQLLGTSSISQYPNNVLSVNPPISGTVYQNNNLTAIEINLPVYATTSGTSGYVTVAKGASSTPTSIGNQYVSGDTSDTSEQIIRLRVPAGWYYEFTASGVTFGTASVFAE